MTAQRGGDSALVPVGEMLPATIAEIESLAAGIQDIVGAEGLSPRDLERVKVPTGGNLFWTLATPEKPNGAPVDEIVGIILYHRLSRAYWATSFEERKGQEKEAPDCFSDDGYQGVGDPGGQCDCCQFNVFGSATKGDGKACKQSRLLFMRLPGSILPRVVVVPRTSMPKVKTFLIKNKEVGLDPWEYVTRLKLERATNKGGIEYGRIVCERAAILSDEERKVSTAMAQFFRPTLERIRIERDDVGEAPAE